MNPLLLMDAIPSLLPYGGKLARFLGAYDPSKDPRVGPYSPAAQKYTKEIQGKYADRARGEMQGPPIPAFTSPTPTTPFASAPSAPPLSPQDRAYQQERARVEAMVKSNPDMQKQDIAEARAKVRDEGMAIWAAKHGGLAKQVKPGQSGYEAIQKTLYPGGTPVPTMSAESEAMLNAIAPANQQGVRPNVTPMPGQLPSFGSATEGMFNAITDGGSLVTPMPAELIEKYKEQLLERAK